MDRGGPAFQDPFFEVSLERPAVPLLAIALHDGHAVRDELAPLLALDDASRLHEEDPHTGELARCAPNRMIARRSRFEVDLNRPLDEAVYVQPEDAWGLTVWRAPLDSALIARSREEHARFYRAAARVIERLLRESPRVLVLDVHSYNHRRGGPGGPPADPARNPELNVGTGSLDRAHFAPVVDAFVHTMRARRDPPLDVRENVRFFGRYFAAWAHRAYPGRACVLACEVKKTFMDEHTGVVDPEALAFWRAALEAGARAGVAALDAVSARASAPSRAP